MYFCTDDHSKSFETENANASSFKFLFKRFSERSFATYVCTDDHSKSIETENANARAFKFFLNVALNARSLCISVQMIILNLLIQRSQTPVRLNSFLNVSLKDRSLRMSVQMIILNLSKQRTQSPVRLNSF